MLAVLAALVVVGQLTAKPEVTTTESLPASVAVAATSSTVVMHARVAEVVDGDTIKVEDPDLGAVTVRVLGIDTPETVKPGSTVGCFGPEASAYAEHVLTGQSVVVTRDSGQDATDRYGRTLAYLTLPDGSDYGVEAVRAGYAKNYVYDRPVVKQPEIAAAEQEAKTARAGLWGPPCNGDTDSEPISTTAATTGPAAADDQAPETPAADPGSTSGGTTVYANCTEVRAAGAAPIYRDQPGYGNHLDRDGNGVACE